MSTPRRAVVIVSGGAAISPFTTPAAGCASGLSAGSTDTGLREALLGAGLAVYTSPANVGRRPVTEDPEANGFDGAPEQLPAELTVNAVGTIDDAGQHLGAFLSYLAAREGFEEVDLVCHSMGGLFARAAIRELTTAGHPLRTRSLTTLGTPWTGSFVAEVAGGLADMSLAAGDPRTESIIREMQEQLTVGSEGAGQQVTSQYLAGADGWNERQTGVLDGIPVTIVAGDWFQAADDDPHAWPHDGLVSLSSALAQHVSPWVMQPRSSHVFHDVHSIFFADQLGLQWHHALTWNPAVFQVVLDAIGSAD
jgi:pimeloyl-ACP methyl ester carboxylesterase